MSTNIDKKQIKDILLKYCVNENGDLDLNDLDFNDFKGDIFIGKWKTHNNIFQSEHKAKEIWQAGHIAEQVHQSCHNAERVYQNSHMAQRVYQYNHCAERVINKAEKVKLDKTGLENDKQ